MNECLTKSVDEFIINHYYGMDATDSDSFEKKVKAEVYDYISNDLGMKGDLSVDCKVDHCTMTVDINYNEKCYEWILKPSE